MMSLIEYPIVAFVVAVPLLSLMAQAGVRFRRWRPMDEETRQDFNVLLGAALTFLALIIGFSFSMASGRYDQRKNYEEAEANAIGTAYVRADLLPAPDATKVRSLLKAYLDQRVQFYSRHDDGELARIAARTTQLQTELWSAVKAPAAAAPTPIAALVVAGMNDVLNSQGYSQAAFWYRLPLSAWFFIGCISICCNFLVGYGLRSTSTARGPLFIFPLFIALAIAFISDIDSPRRGVIRVIPQNLISLANSMPAS
jgi:hypothetical protein